MSNEKVSNYNRFLEHLSEGLDIPPSKYQLAVERYTAVGNWLNQNTNGQIESKIYPQGSFRYGTVIRPLKDGKDADYDIDLVCEIQADKTKSAPSAVKHYVGDRLKEHAKYKDMLDDEGRRCWTLNYAEADGIGFHLDVLPSVPEDVGSKNILNSAGVPFGFANQAIALTDHVSDDYEWASSNPNGYADWFEQKNRVMFRALEKSQKSLLFESNEGLYKSVDDVPGQLVKTPLQRAIQILKRHRDFRFFRLKSDDDKPISMIITTLAAVIYQNEPDVYSALTNIITKLSNHAELVKAVNFSESSMSPYPFIKRRQDGTWYLPNPVNPAENFADKWHENGHRKAKAFFQWVEWANTDILAILDYSNATNLEKSMSPFFGAAIVKEAATKTYPVNAPLIIRHRDKPSIEVKNPEKPWGSSGS